jgi:hypothetical protein
MDLVKSGTVEFELAKAAANSPSDFDLQMNILGGMEASREPGVEAGSEISGFTK